MAKNVAPPDSTGSNLGGRNHSLDTLRGAAIVLMVIDHIAGLIFDQSIADSPIRWLTRLSMPLFCVLMGFFFDPERRQLGRRFVQIVAAAVLVNLFFWPLYNRIEILGSLLVAYVLFCLSGWLFPVFVISILFYASDFLATWLDFPPTIVVSFVAQGMILRRFGWLPAGLVGVFLTGAAAGIHSHDPDGVNHLLCLFVLPATGLVQWGAIRPNLTLVGLNWIGRHPLVSYVGQYYLLFAIMYAIG